MLRNCVEEIYLERSQRMAIKKEIFNMGMPWESGYGYSQAVKVGDTIYVSG